MNYLLLMEFKSKQYPSSRYKVWLYKIKDDINDEDKAKLKNDLKVIASSHSNEGRVFL